jgi:hypothetical protein
MATPARIQADVADCQAITVSGHLVIEVDLTATRMMAVSELMAYCSAESDSSPDCPAII